MCGRSNSLYTPLSYFPRTGGAIFHDDSRECCREIGCTHLGVAPEPPFSSAARWQRRRGLGTGWFVWFRSDQAREATILGRDGRMLMHSFGKQHPPTRNIRPPVLVGVRTRRMRLGGARTMHIDALWTTPVSPPAEDCLLKATCRPVK